MDGAVSRREPVFADFVSRVLDCAEAAVDRSPARWSLGPLDIGFGSNDERQLVDFMRGLALRPTSAGRQDFLTLDLLVGDAAGVEAPPAWPLPVLDDDHRRRRHADREVALFSWEEGAVWHVLDRRRRHGVYWARDRAALPEWDLGAPFRNLLAWALEDEGLSMLHAAGFGYAAQPGLLVAGAGGAGKSSTAFVALREAGMTGVGDDFIALACEPAPETHGLFTTLKLDAASLTRLSVEQAAVANAGRPAGEKARLYMRELLPGSDRPAMAVAALAVPTVVDAEESDYRTADGGRLLRALAPSSLFLLPGHNARRFGDLGRLVRQLPCFELLLGRDPGELAAMLQRLLEEVGDG